MLLKLECAELHKKEEPNDPLSCATFILINLALLAFKCVYAWNAQLPKEVLSWIGSW